MAKKRGPSRPIRLPYEALPIVHRLQADLMERRAAFRARVEAMTPQQLEAITPEGMTPEAVLANVRRAALPTQPEALHAALTLWQMQQTLRESDPRGEVVVMKGSEYRQLCWAHAYKMACDLADARGGKADLVDAKDGGPPVVVVEIPGEAPVKVRLGEAGPEETVSRIASARTDAEPLTQPDAAEAGAPN